MANNLSKYVQDKWLAWLKGTNMPAAPATLYLALYTSDPDDTNSLTGEVSGGTYVRQAITTSTGWSATSGDAPEQISNAAAIDWTTTLPACTLHGWKLMDSSSGAGNAIYFGLFSPNITVNAGDPTSFAIGALVLQIGNP